MRIYLASRSPRRRELLHQLDIAQDRRIKEGAADDADHRHRRHGDQHRAADDGANVAQHVQQAANRVAAHSVVGCHGSGALLV